MTEHLQPPVFRQPDSPETSPDSPKPKKAMDKSTKLIITISTAVLFIILTAFGLFVGYNSYQETKIARAKELHEANIENLMSLSICAKFSDSEQSRLESARNTSPERLKVVLAQIHEERREFWLQEIKSSNEAIDDVNKRTNKALNLGVYNYVANTLDEQKSNARKSLEKAIITAEAFNKTVESINRWKPMSWDQYSKIKNQKPLEKDLDKILNKSS